MKILLLGANGQVGFELLRSLPPLGTLLAASRDGRLDDGSDGLAVDLGDLDGLGRVLDAEQPDVIVNAAAYTGVDKAESEEGVATAINAAGPAALATWAAAHGALLVHYSTDYVFDGRGSRPYRETDATAPLGAYGRSKRAGEEALEASGASFMNFRTAWVYGARGHNFLLTMLRLGADRDHLRVVADQVGAPTPAHVLADATALAIERWSNAPVAVRAQLLGHFHLVPSGQTSWHGFAEAIFEHAASRRLIARRPVVEAIGSDQFSTPARRPAYSVMDNARFRHSFHWVAPTWQDGLAQVMDCVAATAIARTA